MSEKIDLAEIEQDAREHWVMRRDDTLALVAAVRAARKLAPRVIPQSIQGREFLAALAPFTDSSDRSDSAEVRSDD